MDRSEENSIVKVVSSPDEAYELIQQALDGLLEEELVELDIQGEWSKIRIRITGDNYHASLNGRLVRALADLQTQLNRLYANAIYGKSAKALSNEERDEIELIFEVSEGSSLIEVNLGDWLEKLSQAGLEKMTGTEMVVCALGIGVIYGCYKGYKIYSERMEKKESNDVDLARIDAQTKQHEQLITMMSKQNDTIRLAVQERKQFDDNVLKSVPTADSVEINERTYSKDEIAEANRSERKSGDVTRIDGKYIVTSIATKGDGFIISLENSTSPAFKASVSKDKFFDYEIDELWAAERDGTLIDLKLTARSRQGVISSASLIGLLPSKPEDPTAAH